MPLTAFFRLQHGNGYFIMLPSKPSNSVSGIHSDTASTSSKYTRNAVGISTTREWVEVTSDGSVRDWRFIETSRNKHTSEIMLFDAERMMFVHLLSNQVLCSSDRGATYYTLAEGSFVRSANIPINIIQSVDLSTGSNLMEHIKSTDHTSLIHNRQDQGQHNGRQNGQIQDKAPSLNKESDCRDAMYNKHEDSLKDHTISKNNIHSSSIHSNDPPRWIHSRGAFVRQTMGLDEENPQWKELNELNEPIFSFTEVSYDSDLHSVYLQDMTRDIFLRLTNDTCFLQTNTTTTTFNNPSAHTGSGSILYTGYWDISPFKNTNVEDVSSSGGNVAKSIERFTIDGNIATHRSDCTEGNALNATREGNVSNATNDSTERNTCNSTPSIHTATNQSTTTSTNIPILSAFFHISNENRTFIQLPCEKDGKRIPLESWIEVLYDSINQDATVCSNWNEVARDKQKRTVILFQVSTRQFVKLCNDGFYRSQNGGASYAFVNEGRFVRRKQLEPDLSRIFTDYLS